MHGNGAGIGSGFPDVNIAVFREHGLQFIVQPLGDIAAIQDGQTAQQIDFFAVAADPPQGRAFGLIHGFRVYGEIVHI